MFGELIGLSGAAVWAAVSGMMRAVSEKVSPSLINGLRLSVGAVSLALVLLALGRLDSLLSLGWSTIAVLVATGLLAHGVGDTLFVRSMQIIGAARAMPLSGLSPLLTTILAALLLGEHVSWLTAVGGLLALTGVYMLALPGGLPGHSSWLSAPSDILGVLLAVATAACWSGSTLMLKPVVANSDLLAMNLVRLTAAGAGLLATQLPHLRRIRAARPSPNSLGIIVLAGPLGALSAGLFLTSLQYAGAAKAAILVSTSPLFGLPISLLFLGEKITRRILCGTLLSVFGVWLVLVG